jgi:hypothetical protein
VDWHVIGIGKSQEDNILRHLGAGCVEGNIKRDLVEITCEGAELIYLAQDRSIGGLL